jgi:heme/copper-type cytochrome/quinol oxidase subunit 2
MYNKIKVMSEKDFNDWLASGVVSDSAAVKDSTTNLISN